MAGRADRRAENMDPIPETNPEKVEKAEKSYFSAAVESVTPWTGFTRSSTPKPAAFTGEASGLKNQHGGFQSTYQVVPAKYPSDCPPTNAKWFYAVDVCSPNIVLTYATANESLLGPQVEAKALGR